MLQEQVSAHPGDLGARAAGAVGAVLGDPRLPEPEGPRQALLEGHEPLNGVGHRDGDDPVPAGLGEHARDRGTRVAHLSGDARLVEVLVPVQAGHLKQQ